MAKMSMNFDLPTLARAQGVRRKAIAIRPIVPTQAQAQELAAILMPSVQIWAEAKARILAGYPSETRDGLTTDSASDIQAAIDQTAEEFNRLVWLITPRLKAWAVKVEKWHRLRWAGVVQAATNVSLATVLTALSVQETVDTFIARNVALVKDISAQAQSRISDAVFRGYQQNKPLRDVAKEIDEAVKLGRKRALRIASHQNANFSAALDRERQTEAGIEKFQWWHSRKLHPRAEHVARDGKIYEWKKPPEDLPGELPNCGCRAAAYLDLMAGI